MMKNTIANVAANMTTEKLAHVSRTIEAELLAFFATGREGTQAHLGQIEMMTACSEELASRMEVMITGECR